MTTHGLADKIASKKAMIGVIGLGYVGLPLIRAFVRAGFKTMGFDVDQSKVDKLKAGQSYIKHIDSAAIASLISEKQFEPTSDMARLREADCIIICVPTPLNESRDPDLSYIEGTAHSIAASLRPGHLVVLESTTHPTTTRENVLPVLNATGLTAGKDYFLAFSPEREDPGNPNFESVHHPQKSSVATTPSAVILPVRCTATRSSRWCAFRAWKLPRRQRFWKTPIAP